MKADEPQQASGVEIEEPSTPLDQAMPIVLRILKELNKPANMVTADQMQTEYVQVEAQHVQMAFNEVNLQVDLNNDELRNALLLQVRAKVQQSVAVMSDLKQSLWVAEEKLAAFLLRVHDKFAKHGTGSWKLVVTAHKGVMGKDKLLQYVRLGLLLHHYPLFKQVNWRECDTVHISEIRTNSKHMLEFVNSERAKSPSEQHETVRKFVASYVRERVEQS